MMFFGRSGYPSDHSAHHSESPPASLPKRGEAGPPGGFSRALSAEGRFDSHYKSFMKKSFGGGGEAGAGGTAASGAGPQSEHERGERVMSPTTLNLQADCPISFT